MEHLNAADGSAAGLVARPSMADHLNPIGMFYVQHVRDGVVIWEGECPNTVTTQGKNAILDKFLDLGAAYAGVAMGLHTTVGNASSTYASPSPQVEATVIAARLAPTFSAASAGSKATSSAVSFSITGTATITGCFLVLGATGILTVSNTAATAILLSSGTFSGGSRSVVNGDTLNVTYSLAL